MAKKGGLDRIILEKYILRVYTSTLWPDEFIVLGKERIRVSGQMFSSRDPYTYGQMSLKFMAKKGGLDRKSLKYILSYTKSLY